MSRVAICLAGEMRYWEIMKHIFKSWDVDFFVSTWDTTNREKDNYPYKFHGSSDINDDMLETFYDTYGLEPDEQSMETQNKSIKPIEESSINTCFESYNITLKSVIPQITYCVY